MSIDLEALHNAFKGDGNLDSLILQVESGIFFESLAQSDDASGVGVRVINGEVQLGAVPAIVVTLMKILM